MVAPKELFRINHYTSTAIDLHQHPCRSWVQPVHDDGLAWVPMRLLKCKVLACDEESTPLECWPFCELPWTRKSAEPGKRDKDSLSDEREM